MLLVLLAVANNKCLLLRIYFWWLLRRTTETTRPVGCSCWARRWHVASGLWFNRCPSEPDRTRHSLRPAVVTNGVRWDNELKLYRYRQHYVARAHDVACYDPRSVLVSAQTAPEASTISLKCRIQGIPKKLANVIQRTIILLTITVVSTKLAA